VEGILNIAAENIGTDASESEPGEGSDDEAYSLIYEDDRVEERNKTGKQKKSAGSVDRSPASHNPQASANTFSSRASPTPQAPTVLQRNQVPQPAPPAGPPPATKRSVSLYRANGAAMTEASAVAGNKASPRVPKMTPRRLPKLEVPERNPPRIGR